MLSEDRYKLPYALISNLYNIYKNMYKISLSRCGKSCLHNTLQFFYLIVKIFEFPFISTLKSGNLRPRSSFSFKQCTSVLFSYCPGMITLLRENAASDPPQSNYRVVDSRRPQGGPRYRGAEEGEMVCLNLDE